MDSSNNTDGSNNIAYITCFFGTNPQRIYDWNKKKANILFSKKKPTSHFQIKEQSFETIYNSILYTGSLMKK